MSVKKSLIFSLVLVVFACVISLVLFSSLISGGEKQREINKEEGIKKAIEFAELKNVSLASWRQVNYSHTRYLEVLGINSKGRMMIGVDPVDREVVRMVKLCPYPGILTEKMTLEKEKAVQICKNFLKKKKLPEIPKGYFLKVSKVKDVLKMKQYEVVYRHVENDVPVLADFISFLLGGSGEVISYSKVHHDVTVSTKPKVNKKVAVRSAREILGKGTLKDYSPKLEVLDVSLKIVYPNNYFEKWTWEWSDEQALVWVVQFGKKRKPAIDIWIDAHQGNLHGGEIYERPIPELIGIPNQTGDITGIWQPALDKMQYNTGTAHTILADTDEATVVDAIADGFIFILQTHGSTTATAEYARLGHSGDFDIDTLEPDEVPENDLYYALVSCCYSGHDGSGDDFKDTFIDQGALCFQGYYPSINPDPYETSLVSYLALGECLYNAHNLAVAATSPSFDIIIRWQAWCLNAVYLAPLRVTINAPSSAYCSFTISADVYNGEAALGTTANDVFAFLELPPGFTITSGSLLQNTPSISYGSSWTASWTVSAPVYTYGDQTFDVVVWSDNLGVAVHDFDNPYHKFSVNVSCPGLIPFHEIIIREIFRWWYWAVDLYPENIIPRKILEYRDFFLEKYRTEYFFRENPLGFIETMIEITRLEREFVKELKRKDFNRKDIKEYINALDRMGRFLVKASKKKITDTFGFLEEFGKLQKTVNAKAAIAFGTKKPGEMLNTR